MFTGIVQDVGKVKAVKASSGSFVVTISSQKICSDSARGDSISVNGVCLTISSLTSSEFMVDVMPETVNRTNFSKIVVGSKVNLERALTVNSLMGGHIVQGHVDGLGKIESIIKKSNSWLLNVLIDTEIGKYLVEKGSITINGVSLTIASYKGNSFMVSLIPTTTEDTNFSQYKVGDIVNLEVDILGKYLFHYLERVGASNKKSNISKEFLLKHGF